MTYQGHYPVRSHSTLTPWHELSVGNYILHEASTAPVSGTWPAANRAIYIPFTLYGPETVRKMFCGNGGAVSGNVDVGIYNAAGTRLVSSGSTAQASINVLQVFDITDTTIGPGYYYMALALDNTTGTILNSNPAVFVMPVWGVKQEAAAFPLPATATFANVSSAYLPMVGLSMVTSI